MGFLACCHLSTLHGTVAGLVLFSTLEAEREPSSPWCPAIAVVEDYNMCLLCILKWRTAQVQRQMIGSRLVRFTHCSIGALELSGVHFSFSICYASSLSKTRQDIRIAREVCGHSPAGKRDFFEVFGLNDAHMVFETQTAAQGQEAGSPGKVLPTLHGSVAPACSCQLY